MEIFACEGGLESNLAENTRKARHIQVRQADRKLGTWGFSILPARVRFSRWTKSDTHSCSAITDFGGKTCYFFYTRFCHFHSISRVKTHTIVQAMPALAKACTAITDMSQLLNHCHTNTAGVSSANRQIGRSNGCLAVIGRHWL